MIHWTEHQMDLGELLWEAGEIPFDAELEHLEKPNMIPEYLVLS